MTNNIFIGEPVGPLMAGPDSPIFGYKVIRVRWNSGAPVIVPPHYFNNETAFQANSHCKKVHLDSDSFQACTCGFYYYHGLEEARKHLANFRFSSNCFITQVALSGTVIDAEKGMKSTGQRVRQIAVPPCWNCSATADAFVEHESGYLIPSCRSCLEAQNLSPIEFSEFQRLTKLPNFNAISLLPLKDNSPSSLQRVFGNVDAREKIAQGIRELFRAGDTSGLITAKFELDEVIEDLMAADNG